MKRKDRQEGGKRREEMTGKGKKTHEIYELNAENNFAISLCDLRKQHYEIKELHAQGNVSYYVNF